MNAQKFKQNNTLKSLANVYGKHSNIISPNDKTAMIMIDDVVESQGRLSLKHLQLLWLKKSVFLLFYVWTTYWFSEYLLIQLFSLLLLRHYYHHRDTLTLYFLDSYRVFLILKIQICHQVICSFGIYFLNFVSCQRSTFFLKYEIYTEFIAILFFNYLINITCCVWIFRSYIYLLYIHITCNYVVWLHVLPVLHLLCMRNYNVLSNFYSPYYITSIFSPSCDIFKYSVSFRIV